MTPDKKQYQHALDVGRPPEVVKLFPKSQALIVSSGWLREALYGEHVIILAANARNELIVRGVLHAAQRANSAVIIEVAKSECNYTSVNFQNIAKIVDGYCNELEVAVPVIVHADHYSIKNSEDIEHAKVQIPSMFEHGMTSIAIDASHLPSAENVLANIELSKYIPYWAGLETEVGEIKGKAGLSTSEEATFLITALNAHGIYPDLIALNNGTTHGIEESDAGIQVGLTEEIHNDLRRFGVAGAQHGTSGNSFSKLRDIQRNTNTLKANVATALQFLSWFVEVNEYGNAVCDENGAFVLVKNTPDEFRALWADMVAYAEDKGWKGGDYKKLSLPFDNRIMALSEDVKIAMASRVENFAYKLMTDVFGSQDSAPTVIDSILAANTYAPDPTIHVTDFVRHNDWSEEYIRTQGAIIDQYAEEIEGDFDD